MISAPPAPSAAHHNRYERWAAWALCGVVGLGTLARFLGRVHWLLELTTHFAVQAMVLAALAALLLAIRRHGWAAWVTLILAMMNGGGLWPFYQPVSSVKTVASQPTLTFVTANVLSSNRNRTSLREWLIQEQVEVVFLCEPDAWWEAEVAQWKDHWPYQMTAIRPDNFGVGILSRYPLIEPRIIALANDNPALECRFEAHGVRWTVLGLHPFPPRGRRYSEGRDAQLQGAAAHVQTLPHPLIVAGDLNTTSSSPVFGDLLRATDLRDSRAGRGLQPSWPAGHPLFQIPIDHVLMSGDLQVHDRRVGPPIGSDHLPVLVRVSRANPGADN